MSRLGPLGKEPIQLAMSLGGLRKSRHTLTVSQPFVDCRDAPRSQRQLLLPWLPFPLEICNFVAFKVVQLQLHPRARDMETRIRFRSNTQLSLGAKHAPAKLRISRKWRSAAEVEQHRGVPCRGLRCRQASRQSDVVGHVAGGCTRHGTCGGVDEIEMGPLKL